jgi:single-stranded-DNA-specific exonuclease
MTNQLKTWEILFKQPVIGSKLLIDVLLNNRGIKTEKEKMEFLNPTDPMDISLKSIGIKEIEVDKAIDRIKKAKKLDEHVIVYGDYDADGITGTATMWETLHNLGIFVLPHIPERFSEGYGLNFESVKKLKEKDPKLSLIVTVDHGITAGEKINKIKKMGIDVIITDHHQMGKNIPKPLALIYTTQIGGSALAWFFAREIVKRSDLLTENKAQLQDRLSLAAIGTIADQLPLIGVNRSIVKYGLRELNKTKRPGLLALFKESGLETDITPLKNVGTYEVGYIIAPRINAMGRLKHGLESLRLLCTKDKVKAFDIAKNIGGTNTERQKMVEKMVTIALTEAAESKGKIIVIAGEDYHEGVIGLAAGRLVEEFYRPAIVLSVKGGLSKASARSISGFNIIEAIRTVNLHLEGGGHPMAAGFSIETNKIDKFTKEINKYAEKFLTSEILSKKIKIDCELDFNLLNYELLNKLDQFEPTGLGNPGPTFVAEKVKIIDFKTVGREARHLKLNLKQNEHVFDSIFFGGGEKYSKLISGSDISIVFQPEENLWNGNRSIQLRIRDVRV